MSDLERIERQLIKIKWILLLILIVLMIGFFTPKGLLDLIGVFLLGLTIIGAVIYFFLKILESVLEKKAETKSRETARELFDEIAQRQEEDLGAPNNPTARSAQ